MKIVTLASGGLDSSLLMYLLSQKGHEIFPLFIDYGQLSAVNEWQSLKKISKNLNLKPYRIDISGFGKSIDSGINNKKLDIKKFAFLPNRNLLFLTVGSAYAFNLSIFNIAIGLISNPIFPDQTKQFLASAEQSIKEALGADMRIIAPLIDLNKMDIYQLAMANNVPIEDIYYCHSGNEDPCGECIACLEHVEAIKELKKIKNI